MSEKNKTFTITAALPYANGPLHIGHLAGVYIPADIFSRYQRLINNDVAFICGSDEHGVAISLQAKRESITPKELIDRYDKLIRDSFEEFGISFDNYSRTSRKIHHETHGGYSLPSVFLSKNFSQTLTRDSEYTEFVGLQYFDELEY